jgi:hypothetical protein
MGEVGGTGTFIPVAYIIRNVITQTTRNAVLGSWTAALIAAGITPVTSTVFILVFVVTALVDTSRLIKDKVGVTGETLKL